MTKILPSDYNFVLPCAPETLVRLGIDKDGGYIVDKKIIDKTNILVSFGMADEYSFEKEFLKKNEQKRVFIFDYSISKRFYIQEIFKNIRRLLKFKRKFKDLKNTLNTYANFKEFIKKNGVSFNYSALRTNGRASVWRKSPQRAEFVMMRRGRAEDWPGRGPCLFDALPEWPRSAPTAPVAGF